MPMQISHLCVEFVGLATVYGPYTNIRHGTHLPVAFVGSSIVDRFQTTAHSRIVRWGARPRRIRCTLAQSSPPHRTRLLQCRQAVNVFSRTFVVWGGGVC